MKKIDAIVVAVVLVVVGVVVIMGIHHKKEMQEWVESTDEYKAMQEHLEKATEAAEEAKAAVDDLKEKDAEYRAMWD